MSIEPIIRCRIVTQVRTHRFHCRRAISSLVARFPHIRVYGTRLTGEKVAKDRRASDWLMETWGHLSITTSLVNREYAVWSREARARQRAEVTSERPLMRDLLKFKINLFIITVIIPIIYFRSLNFVILYLLFDI